jgi:diguanylate cyclase (GGDEF)-like protein
MSEPQSHTHVRLLVVDDVANNRDVLGRLFRRRGYEVVEAATGCAALELITKQHFNAVLLDVVMPEMDGLEVLRRIRAIHSTAILPVIMVTAMAESKDVVQALELGANDYITKPIDVGITFARVQNHIARQQAERALAEQLHKLENINRELENEIAQRKISDARIQQMAHHDSLTGLSNRSYFRDQLARSFDRVEQDGGSFDLLFIDLDQFKLINDSLGHRIGDLLLATIGERLKRAVNEDDTVARLGGDEFAIIRFAKRPEDTNLLVDRVMKAVALPYDIEGHRLFITSSIGIARAPDDGNDPELLLANADLALYRAKAEGRGRRRFFEAEMNERVRARQLLERDLRTATSEDQFELNYQPQLNLSSGRISGFEALLRWRHPERGLIPPLDFIPLAEDTGLIVPVSQWLLGEACREARTWPDDIKLAVNLSPVHFRSGTLVHDVVGALSLSGLEPSRLELEITESVLLDDNKTTMQALHELRRWGVGISIDDFGTGYSSFTYLRMFPFDKIKIDQSFVRDLPTKKDSTAIVRAIIGVASTLGMVTTAEGVETQEQLTYLQAEGCTEVQGYLISRPLLTTDVRRILAKPKDIERNKVA